LHIATLKLKKRLNNKILIKKKQNLIKLIYLRILIQSMPFLAFYMPYA